MKINEVGRCTNPRRAKRSDQIFFEAIKFYCNNDNILQYIKYCFVLHTVGCHNESLGGSCPGSMQSVHGDGLGRRKKEPPEDHGGCD